MKSDDILTELVNRYSISDDDYIELISAFQEELNKSWEDGVEYGLDRAKEALADVIIP
jgi:hypothetical protein